MQYKVVIDAQPAQGYTAAQAREKLCRLFKTSVGEGNRFFNGKPVVVKKGLDSAAAEQYKQMIERCGARAAILPQDKFVTASSLPPETNRCPNCHYQAHSSDDALFNGAGGLGECPRCGIIVQKFTEQLKARSEKTVPGDSSQGNEAAFPVSGKSIENNQADTADAAYVIASRRQRVMAGIFTLLCGMVIFSIITFLVVSYNAWSAASTIRTDKTQVPAKVISSFLEKQKSTYIIVFLLVAVYLLVVVPEIKGQTWGQKRFGLHIVNSQGNEDSNVKAFWLRLLGQGISILSLGKLPRKSEDFPDDRTMADVLSGTTLMAEPQKPIAIGKGFVIVALCITFIMAGFQGVENDWLMTVRYEKPQIKPLSPEEIKQKRDLEAAREAALENMIIRGLEENCKKGDASACQTLEDLKPVK